MGKTVAQFADSPCLWFVSGPLGFLLTHLQAAFVLVPLGYFTQSLFRLDLQKPSPPEGAVLRGAETMWS